MVRRFIQGTKAALSPSAIKEAMRAGMEMAETQAAVMPTSREQHVHLRLPPEGPIPAEQAAAERAAGRARFASPSARPAQVDRFTVPGTDPTAGLRALSWAGVPDVSHEVWGCYPSAAVAHPTHLVDGRLGVPASAAGPIELPWVEWTVVHAAGPGLTAALTEAAQAVATASHGAPADVEEVRLDRAESWIARPRTDPLPFDEDVAALLCRMADVEPAACLGLHRRLSWGVWGPPENRNVMVEPTGVALLGRPEARLREGRARLAGAAPVRARADDDLGVDVAVLDASLRIVRDAVPWTGPPPAATSFPSLPADAEELLLAYIEIVGVHPQDCFGVSTSIRDQQTARVLGAETARGDAASVATLVHRRHDSYEDGRRRFAEWCQLEVGAPLLDERATVDAIERWGARAVKLKNLDTLGLGDYRQHGVGDAVDTAFYTYCAGPAPRP